LSTLSETKVSMPLSAFGAKSRAGCAPVTMTADPDGIVITIDRCLMTANMSVPYAY
jgi:hypothetical protein